MREVFEEFAIVHHFGDDLLHVVWLIGRRRKNGAQRFTQTCWVVGDLANRRLGDVVLWQEAEQEAHIL